MSQPRSNNWNASQIVANNMTKARELRGITQGEVAERLARHTGAKWTKTSVAQAEGSVLGNRVRSFTAVELFALARTFDLPVPYFLAPPDEPESVGVDLPEVDPNNWDYYVHLIGGHEGNKELLAKQFARYAHVSSVAVPPSDATGEAELLTREPLQPADVYGAAFHGLMLGNQRGAVAQGAELAGFIKQLKDLIFALESFQHYQPGRWVDSAVAEEMRDQREMREERRSAEWAEARRAIEREREADQP